ncbi:head maturation protease, ClpP-related [Aquipseudomonas alcaligenes]|uniref:Clp protease ClpP n=1 Tax=Aquipseudomonas alcaligenes TaxID=43263 RepID=A0AA42N204_AQUAC|nr:head maturation protease, ClpP-related [Pseudomonas alcaligenes]MDH1055300.1 Clp protease ClpP [Pseudomonas alcaligenes]
MIKHKHLALALSIALASPGFAFSGPPRIFNKAAGTPELQAEHWYSIRDIGEGDAKVIEVFIYGEIGYWGVTSGDFIRDLQAQDDGVSKVLVHFDTIGGDLFDGIAIHNTLRALGERCTGRIDGACFSAGSVAVCGAHRIEMADNALMMIHNPWTWMAGGSEELRKMADMMDKAREGIIASYQHRELTVDEAELSRMIDEETWLTPAEAKAFGFVDEILGAGQPLARNAAMGKILNRYRNVPEAARQLVAEVEPDPAPTPDPEPEPAPEPQSPEAAGLAAQLAVDCTAAGLSACLPALIKSSGLKSAEAVQAELTRAKAIHAVCVVAKLPDEAPGLIAAGASPDEARLKLWDKLASNSGAVEISSLPPLDDLPQNSAYQPPVPSDVYARRRNQASKGGKQA